MPARLDRVRERTHDRLPWRAARAGRAGSRRWVLPVTVMQLPSKSPASSSIFITAGVPPTWCRSSITYWPLGLKSASIGIRSLTRWKSSSVEVDADRARHRDQVQHRVGRAAEHRDQHHRVLERGARHDVARLEVHLEHAADRDRRVAALLRACAGSSAGVDELYGRLMPSASIGRRHRVGGVHAAAGAGAGTATGARSRGAASR